MKKKSINKILKVQKKLSQNNCNLQFYTQYMVACMGQGIYDNQVCNSL